MADSVTVESVENTNDFVKKWKVRGISLSALFATVATVLIGISFHELETDKKGDDGCYPSSSKYLLTYSTYFGIMSFIFFIIAFYYTRKSDIKVGKKEEFLHSPTKIFFLVLFSLYNFVYIFLKTYSYSTCGNSDVFYRELWTSLVSYLLNNILVFYGRYEFSLNLRVFFVMAFVIGIELMMLVSYGEDVKGGYIFGYFNIKIAILLYEIFANRHFYDFLFIAGDREAHCFTNLIHRQTLFVLFLGSKIAKQVFYLTPDDIRYSGTYYNAWYGVYTAASCVEIVCLIVMIFFMRRKANPAQEGMLLDESLV